MKKISEPDSIGKIENENERQEGYSRIGRETIDKERTHNNYHIVPAPDTRYMDFINNRIKEVGVKRKVKDDAVRMATFVIGAKGDYFKDMTPAMERAFFTDCVNFIARQMGKENIISAVVHKDETNPHLHLNLIPLENNRLCAKDLFCPKNLRTLQTELYEQVGKKYHLERGKEGSQAKHLSTAEFKAKKIIEQAEELKEEIKEYADALKRAYNGEFPKNKNQLKEQVIALVAENKDLNRRLEISMKETLQYANENRDLRKDNERKTQGYRIAVKLQKENPREFDRIVYGKPIGKNLDGFFASVLSMFTPEITTLFKKHINFFAVCLR